jgi:hypothetical protein
LTLSASKCGELKPVRLSHFCTVASLTTAAQYWLGRHLNLDRHILHLHQLPLVRVVEFLRTHKKNHPFRNLGTSVFLGAAPLEFEKSERRPISSGRKSKHLQCPVLDCRKRYEVRAHFLDHLRKHTAYRDLTDEDWDEMMSAGEFCGPAATTHPIAPASAPTAPARTLMPRAQHNPKRSRDE